MQEDAQALLQTCVRNTKNIEPISCTDRELLKIAVTEVMRVKEHNKPNTVVNLDIQIAINERGTITEVLVNKNLNTLENMVSKKLRAIEPLFPARKNGVFIASTLTYHIDDATLTNYILLDNRENAVVVSDELVPSPTVAREPDSSDLMVPFVILEEPPSTKKCAALETLIDKQTCFTDFVNDYIDKRMRNRLDKLKKNESQRVIILFTIDKNGNATDVKVRAKDLAAEKEVLKIMEKFPQVMPAKHRGSVVKTTFSVIYKF